MTTSPADLSSLRIDRQPPASGQGGGSRRWPILAAVAVVVLFAAIAWAVFPRSTEVKVTQATASGGGAITGSGITANGYVVARTKASVSAKIPGRLAFLGVTEGSHVKKGEVLARIESNDYRAALAAARATASQSQVELDQARREYVRAQSLRQSNVLSEADLENAKTRADAMEAQLEAARAQVALAAANLENTNVRAPFDGTVLRKDAEVGEIVAPSSAGGGLTRTAIVTMADLATLEVEVDVNEAYIAQIRNGQESRNTLDAYPDTSFAGRVRQVVPTADRQKATVQVKVSILDRDPRILPEMGAKVEFVRESGQGNVAAAPGRVLVHKAAVIRAGEEARVWVVEEGKVSSRAVEVGPEHGDHVEIRKGLSGGETLVIDAPAGLKDGARVRVAGS